MSNAWKRICFHAMPLVRLQARLHMQAGPNRRHDADDALSAFVHWGRISSELESRPFRVAEDGVRYQTTCGRRLPGPRLKGFCVLCVSQPQDHRSTSCCDLSYCNLEYSALASFRMGMSGSASFQTSKKSL
jgi:hypothetical protein